MAVSTKSAPQDLLKKSFCLPLGIGHILAFLSVWGQTPVLHILLARNWIMGYMSSPTISRSSFVMFDGPGALLFDNSVLAILTSVKVMFE